MTLRATEQPAIALKFGRRSAEWVPGEIIVFERCGWDELGDGELCLVQTGAARRRPGRTIVAIARVATIARGRELRIEPITPSGPLFVANDENLVSVLRAAYRAR